MAKFNFGRTKDIANRSNKYLEEALFRRVFQKGSEERSVRPELNKFLKSRKRVFKWEVGDTVKELRHRKLYGPALKLSEAMVKRGMGMTVSDQAIHLDILAKSKGITAAETYFADLPEASKNCLCYGALLNCYCKELMTEKAEGLMEKMKELKFNTSSMAYNSLMTLYTKTGDPEKVPAVIQEMKSSDVTPDSYTYNVWMRALAASNDISGVERVYEEMKRDGKVIGDWTNYSNLATIYVNAGLFEKAEEALKELEKRSDKSLNAYKFLMTLYGRTRNLLEVYRVWRSLRLEFRKTPNISYLNMIQVLADLKDLSGAEKTFHEWLSGNPTYDIRIANVLIGAYVKEGKPEKAEELKELARRNGAKANVRTWEIFRDYHLKNGDMNSAVICVTNAMQQGRGDGSKWTPSREVVQTLMFHFEQKPDVDGAEVFIENLKKVEDELEAEVFESLIRTYAAAGKTSQSIRRRLKMENVEVNEESKKLLDVVCVEE